MHLWLIPSIYLVASIVSGLTIPRLEHLYPANLDFQISATSAQALLSAVASGMMAMTGVIFAMAFVTVQFGAIAYSPRLVLWISRDRTMFHSLGMFAGTFTFSLFALAWVDRGRTGNVPAVTSVIVAISMIISLLLFSVLIQRLGNLQISNVLALIGDNGRKTIDEMFPRGIGEAPHARPEADPDVTSAGARIITYLGTPKAICNINSGVLRQLAEQAGCLIVVTCSVGDTLVLGIPILRLYGPSDHISEGSLLRAFDLQIERTFENDPKYALRLLVDIGIKALSPAINDPTTAVQTIDQLEDLLKRMEQRSLNVGEIRDATGKLRVLIPVPSWKDYVILAFEEISHYGADSIQVMRRLRSALNGLLNASADNHVQSVLRAFMTRLDISIDRSFGDPDEKLRAKQGDRQGL